MKITVLITLLNDKRVSRTLRSLSKQSIKPDSIIIADGGSSEEFIKFLKNLLKGYPNVDLRIYPGSFGETRRQAVSNIECDIIVFLDSDQFALPDWLDKLTKPIEQGLADFTAGLLKPFNAEFTNKCQDFINYYEQWYTQHVVKKDITALAMGNSAWRKRIFDVVGNFDDVFVKGGDDFDISIRAKENGFTGLLVEDAIVFHDQSSIDSLWKIFKKKYSYSAGATLAYLKNKDFHSKSGNALTTARCMHPIEFMNLIAKVLGFVKGVIDWRRYSDN